MTALFLDCGDRRIDLSTPRIMGVLNITPDSFSDGGRLYAGGRVDLDGVRRSAEAMLAAGAAMLDVGGESTRPGADPVSEQEELDRVLPVVEALAGLGDAVVSVDTSTPAVMREAARRGAGLINDVRALTRPGALETAASLALPVCLMHMQGTPTTMQEAPAYDDVVAEVRAFLAQRIAACEAAGIPAPRLLVDPGFGFGKSLDHNLTLLSRLGELTDLGPPLLVGLSRKSLLGKLTGRGVQERLPGSLALALLAAQRGASVLRVHDVAETADVLRVLAALDGGAGSRGGAR
jgi:dihydropteroate synthase